MMKDSSGRGHMYWFSLHALLSSVFIDSIERNAPKNSQEVPEASWCFYRFEPIGRVMLADTVSCGVLLRQTNMLRQD